MVKNGTTVNGKELKVSEEEIKKHEEVDEELLESIKFSLKNIKEFSEVQKILKRG